MWERVAEWSKAPKPGEGFLKSDEENPSPALARLRLHSGTLSRPGRGEHVATYVPIDSPRVDFLCCRRAGSPGFVGRPGAVLWIPRKTRGDGAPADATSCCHACPQTDCSAADMTGVAPITGRAPAGAPSRRSECERLTPSLIGSGPRLRTGAILAPAVQQAPCARIVVSVGRGPETSRGLGYESNPQAPRPTPPSRRLAKTPSDEQDGQMTRLIRRF